MENFKFQVNLSGIIDILANHLYSDESVFVRELLQNATDAITARNQHDNNFNPAVEFELITDKKQAPQIIVTDNGIGLTVEEVHAFLSVIGASSKKDELLQKKKDFIGQFGIGLLSCFVIADEIVMISQSLKNSNAVEWRGKSDGTYSVRTLDQKLSVGTRIFLTAKPEKEQFFQKDTLTSLIIKYGNFLQYPILFSGKNSKPKLLNKPQFPWESGDASKQDIISFGQSFFGMKVMDCIPLHAPASNSAGYAFIGVATNSLSVQNHSVYLNRMFLSDKVDNLLPEWVFFAKCVINSTGLRPTASRESFFEDDILKKTKEELGGCIINYLHALKISDPLLLHTIITRHHTAMKLAAISSDDFFDNIFDLIPFETNYGDKTFKEISGTGRAIRYVTETDEFKKISGIAFNQSIEVVNAGYVYESAFFEKLVEKFPDIEFQAFSAEELFWELKELDLGERDEVFDFVQQADSVLKDLGCISEVRKFEPVNLPAIYFRNDDMEFIRRAERSKDVSDELWSGILDNMTADTERSVVSTICFNYNNPLIKKAAKLPKSDVLSVLIKMMYVQALLTGRHPLSQKEMNILTGGLYFLIDKATTTDETR